MLRSMKKKASSAFFRRKSSSFDFTHSTEDSESVGNFTTLPSHSSTNSENYTTTDLATTSPIPSLPQFVIPPPPEYRPLTPIPSPIPSPLADWPRASLPSSRTSHEEQQQSPEPDPFAPRYVPFVDNAALKSNMFTTQGSHYGRVNASIMGGFGGDDESIWLVDDEETDEEAPRNGEQRQNTSGVVPAGGEATAQPPRASTDAAPARPAFHYRSPDLLNDDEFTMAPNPSTQKQSTSPAPNPAPKRGYATISSSILAGFDSDEEASQPETRTSTEQQSPPTSQTTPGLSSLKNPYVTLFEQQDQAMTVAYLRRLEQEGSTGNEMADDFR